MLNQLTLIGRIVSDLQINETKNKIITVQPASTTCLSHVEGFIALPSLH